MRQVRLSDYFITIFIVFLALLLIGCDTISFDLTKPTFVSDKASSDVTNADVLGEFPEQIASKPTLKESEIYSKVFAITDGSKCSKYSWNNRGTAKKSYYRGMGLTYAKAYCSPSIVVSSGRNKPESQFDTTDVLSWYNSDFNRLGMMNDISGKETQRHVWTLLFGLGMRESSGRYCVGRDMSMNFSTADSAEAGLFQASWGARKREPSMTALFNKYQKNKKGCFYEVFKEGYTCSGNDLRNWGTGDGANFQKLSKECPAFSAEYAAILVRRSGGTKGEFGPLRQKKVELNKDCDSMLKQIDSLIESNKAICDTLN